MSDTPGKGQRQALPGAARSIAADREGLFPIKQNLPQDAHWWKVEWYRLYSNDRVEKCCVYFRLKMLFYTQDT